MDFGVFDLSGYPFITVVRKRKEKSGHEQKNLLCALLPRALARCRPLLCRDLMSCTWIFSGPKEEPKKNAHDVAKHIKSHCNQEDRHAQFNKHGL